MSDRYTVKTDGDRSFIFDGQDGEFVPFGVIAQIMNQAETDLLINKLLGERLFNNMIESFKAVTEAVDGWTGGLVSLDQLKAAADANKIASMAYEEWKAA